MSMKRTLFAIALGIVVSGCRSRPMCAATPAASFGVSATVQATCRVLASAALSGTDTGGMASATSSVSLNCTNYTPYSVSLGVRPGNVGAADARTPTDSGAARLRYALSPKSQSVVNQGRMVDTDAVAGTGNGFTQTVVIHGNILAGRYFATGVHADTITVTVIY